MTAEIHHPSEVLDERIISKIRKSAGEAESLRKLHDDQLDLIYKEKWFKMFVPKELGGLSLSLPEILVVEECLSWADGSIGWVVTLCSGAGWFVGFLDPKIVDEILKDDLLCIAGSGAPTGFANVTDNGYLINGAWKYATGALHATAFTMNCYIKKDDQQVYNLDGSPKIASFILKKYQVQLHKTWNSMGMIATGSHSFEVSNVSVSKDHCFSISPANAMLKNAIFQYPFLQLAETTLAVNISGMATRFIDLAEILLTEKVKYKPSNGLQLIQVLADARVVLDTSRKLFYKIVKDSWKELNTKNEIPFQMQSSISASSEKLVQTSSAIVNKLYPLCGLSAADTGKEINRVWRNFHTASQHALFNKRIFFSNEK
jgi:alkylation response protein AidB-like acyl-CoA dehydrogenase